MYPGDDDRPRCRCGRPSSVIDGRLTCGIPSCEESQRLEALIDWSSTRNAIKAHRGDTPTWDDIVKRARGVPLVGGRRGGKTTTMLTMDVAAMHFHLAATLAQDRFLTREQALIRLALGLADVVNEQAARMLDMLNNDTRPILIQKAKERSEG